MGFGFVSLGSKVAKGLISRLSHVIQNSIPDYIAIHRVHVCKLEYIMKEGHQNSKSECTMSLSMEIKNSLPTW